MPLGTLETVNAAQPSTMCKLWSLPDGQVSYLDEATQARLTVDLFRLWFHHPRVKGIIMWGFADDNIWIKNAGIFRKDKSPKQAALAIKKLWAEWQTHAAVPGSVAMLESTNTLT